MLQFVVFEADGVGERNFPPRHAYVHGPNDLPLQSVISLKDGVVTCEHNATTSTALCVQMLTSVIDGPGGLGLLAMPTCLLPPRGEPYLLTLELARHRCMLFLNKLEDWGLTDLPAGHWVVRQFERARQQFTAALVAQRAEEHAGEGSEPPRHGYCSLASKLAGETLSLAVDAGEGLALIQAERGLKDRASGKAFADASAHYTRQTQESVPPGMGVVPQAGAGVVLPGTCPVGCAVSPQLFSDGLARVVQATCDFVTMPMRWIDMEPVEGKYSFAQTDKWIEWAVRVGKLPVHAGPLVDFRPQSVPEWLFIWENDYETLRDLVIEHIQSVVTRYRRTVQRWTVASGLHVNTNFKISFEQIMDLTRVCVALVRKLHPTAKIQLEIAQPWGEYHTTNRRSLPPMLYADAVVQSGLPIDALGLRLQMGHAEPGLATRDLLSLSDLLDRYAQFDRPLAITAIGAPSGAITPTPYLPRAGAAPEDPYEPGYWRKPWTDEQQGEWLARALGVCAGKPYVQSVCWHELADLPASMLSGGRMAPEMPLGGLVTSGGAVKASASRLAQVRQETRAGRAPFTVQ